VAGLDLVRARDPAVRRRQVTAPLVATILDSRRARIYLFHRPGTARYTEVGVPVGGERELRASQQSRQRRIAQ